MADYATLEEALTSGITNMTVLRNNVPNDDSTVAYSTGVNWFYFNGTPVTTIYSSGNSFLGLGVNTEHFRINRRDGKVYYEYIETGKIGGFDFIRFRWHGYSYYNQTGSNYVQQWEIFLISRGIIYLNFFAVPVTTGSGTNNLICGSETLSYSISAGSSSEYTFTASNASAGTGWTVQAGRPNLFPYYTHGEAIYIIPEISTAGIAIRSRIEWVANVPSNTSISIYSKLDENSYERCMNAGPIAGIERGIDLSEKTLYLKIELDTEDEWSSPSIESIIISVQGQNDLKSIILEFNPGSQNSIQNAAGPIIVSYSGLGQLAGEYGFVQAFQSQFTPEELTWKTNPNDEEHFELGTVEWNDLMRAIQKIQTSYGIQGYFTISNVVWTGLLKDTGDI